MDRKRKVKDIRQGLWTFRAETGSKKLVRRICFWDPVACKQVLEGGCPPFVERIFMWQYPLGKRIIGKYYSKRAGAFENWRNRWK